LWGDLKLVLLLVLVLLLLKLHGTHTPNSLFPLDALLLSGL